MLPTGEGTGGRLGWWMRESGGASAATPRSQQQRVPTSSKRTSRRRPACQPAEACHTPHHTERGQRHRSTQQAPTHLPKRAHISACPRRSAALCLRASFFTAADANRRPTHPLQPLFQTIPRGIPDTRTLSTFQNFLFLLIAHLVFKNTIFFDFVLSDIGLTLDLTLKFVCSFLFNVNIFKKCKGKVFHYYFLKNF